MLWFLVGLGCRCVDRVKFVNRRSTLVSSQPMLSNLSADVCTSMLFFQTASTNPRNGMHHDPLRPWQTASNPVGDTRNTTQTDSCSWDCMRINRPDSDDGPGTQCLPARRRV